MENKQMKYRIGLDIGIASVGWAVLENDENGEVKGIIERGVRAFDPVENPKNGDSLAAERRGFRSMRRTLRRRKARIAAARYLCEQNFGIKFDDIFSGEKLTDIYEIRYEALSRKLTDEEFARLLVHFVHRRGFKSNRKTDKTKDDGKILKCISENEVLLNEKGYQTIGEYFYKECRADDQFVTHNKEMDYKFAFNRDKIENEIKLIFEKQRELQPKHKKINADFEKEFLQIFNRQRSYDLGPADPSPYAPKGGLYLDMLGKCEFDGEYRVYQDTACAELFRLYCNINNLYFYDNELHGKRELTEQERKAIKDICIKKGGIIKYSDLRTKMKLPDNVIFGGLNYSQRKKIDKTPEEIAKEKSTNDPNAKYTKKYVYLTHDEVENSAFTTMKGTTTVRKAFEKEFGKDFNLPNELIDTVVFALHIFHDETKLENALRGGEMDGIFKVDEKYIPTIKNIELGDAKPMKLSAKIIYKLLPYLENGLTYDKAMAEIGINHSALGENKRTRLFFCEVAKEVRNPVVMRSISQTFKVINAIVDKYGSPQLVLVEVAREMAKDFRERNETEKRNLENMAHNERIKSLIREKYKKAEPKGIDIVTYKLAEEQNWYDPYSGKGIDSTRLYEPNYVQIDHIIPYSISFDDSYNNKVLVLAGSNQNKGNRTPLQFLDEAAGKRLENWVNTAHSISPTKKKNLLTREVEEGFRDRNLKDTQYITRFILNHLQRNLALAESRYDSNKRIEAIKGGMTAYFRKHFIWGKLRDTDEHHALDAIIVACFTDSLRQKISKFEKMRVQCFRNGDKFIDVTTGKEYVDDEIGKREFIQDFLKFPEPYKGFGDDVVKLNETNPISVSRMVTHKITGSGHDQTIRGLAVDDKTGEEFFISRVPLHKLKLDNAGEIENYYNKDADPILYNAIKKVLQQNSDSKKVDPKKLTEAFKNFKTKGRLVRKIKVTEKTSSYVKLNKVGGVASNGDMVRIDIFTKDGKYYIVPIYAADFYKPLLPNIAVPFKDGGTVMDETYRFAFTLFPNDLVHIEPKDGKKLQLHKEIQTEDGTKKSN
ncbi:MAG: type II CRISPR RNA-guided endonuclease Cas9, partial [Christensenellaceae bacterium]|nr:type II CRISPR RNA-guided endonuclease Cas9 [Christensenellaceae bacterium]